MKPRRKGSEQLSCLENASDP